MEPNYRGSWLQGTVVDSKKIHAWYNVCVAAQFYPWFKFKFSLSQGIIVLNQKELNKG